MSVFTNFLSLAVVLTEDQIRQIMADQMTPLALVKQSGTDYWFVFLLAAVSLVSSVWKIPGPQRGRHSNARADWGSLPYLLWGVIAAWPPTILYSSHWVFFQVHVLTASTALVFLFSTSLVSAWFSDGPDCGSSNVSKGYQAFMVPLVLTTVFLDLVLFSIFLSPF